jgi:hypothetical protein
VAVIPKQARGCDLELLIKACVRTKNDSCVRVLYCTGACYVPWYLVWIRSACDVSPKGMLLNGNYVCLFFLKLLCLIDSEVVWSVKSDESSGHRCIENQHVQHSNSSGTLICPNYAGVVGAETHAHGEGRVAQIAGVQNCAGVVHFTHTHSDTVRRDPGGSHDCTVSNLYIEPHSNMTSSVFSACSGAWQLQQPYVRRTRCQRTHLALFPTVKKKPSQLLYGHTSKPVLLAI